MTGPARAIFNLISDSAHRLSTDAVMRKLGTAKGFTTRELRRAIRELVESGELAYSYELGHSFLERSFNRPVPVSDRIVLAPPGHRVRAVPPAITVRLAPGAAFGYGQHPTTRMALKALDTALAADPRLSADAGSRCLDIGTGSGVLAIAAVLLGMQGARGVDIDACAVAEAGRNVVLNGLENRIRIDASDLETVSGPFGMITANLRRPTLEHYGETISGLLKAGGALILSGLKSDELAALSHAYGALGFEKARSWQEKGWGTLLMRKVSKEESKR